MCVGISRIRAATYRALEHFEQLRWTPALAAQNCTTIRIDLNVDRAFGAGISPKRLKRRRRVQA
jgi:hypothetical protein